jgi:hypothetical protein
LGLLFVRIGWVVEDHFLDFVFEVYLSPKHRFLTVFARNAFLDVLVALWVDIMTTAVMDFCMDVLFGAFVTAIGSDEASEGLGEEIFALNDFRLGDLVLGIFEDAFLVGTGFDHFLNDKFAGLRGEL